MFKNPFAGYDFSNPFGTAAMKRSRSLFGTHTTPREWKHGARDIPFGMGAMSLYVDGTNGSDSNDGESWKTAKATIQAAVDAAISWTQIFIKAGTYAENVFIGTTKRGIALIGESRDSVIIHPPDSYPMWTQAAETTLLDLSLFAEETGKHGGYVDAADHCIFSNINVDGGTWARGITLASAESATIRRLYAVNSNLYQAVTLSGAAAHVEISDCIINLAAGTYGISAENTSESKIFNNDITVLAFSVTMAAASTNNSIFHNNLDSIAPRDYGTNNTFFENFYSGHTNIDNGHGIATEPYAYTGGTDPRPVVRRNSWNAVSLQRSLLRKKTAAQTTQAATAANGTAWVDLKTITPTTSDIELYQLKMTVAGSWAGNAKYRIIVGSTKVYPFPADKNITSGTLESLIFPINIQINETAKLQFRSDNAGDGAGDTVTLDQFDYALVL